MCQTHKTANLEAFMLVHLTPLSDSFHFLLVFSSLLGVYYMVLLI